MLEGGDATGCNLTREELMVLLVALLPRNSVLDFFLGPELDIGNFWFLELQLVVNFLLGRLEDVQTCVKAGHGINIWHVACVDERLWWALPTFHLVKCQSSLLLELTKRVIELAFTWGEDATRWEDVAAWAVVFVHWPFLDQKFLLTCLVLGNLNEDVACTDPPRIWLVP